MRKLPEEQLIQKQVDLLEKVNASRMRLDRILSNLSSVVFETDAEGRWTFLNEAWEEFVGFTRAESIGENFIDYVHPDDREENSALFAPLIERKKSECRHQVRYLCKGGGFVWVEVHAQLLLDGVDRIVGTTGTLSNVHQERLLMEEKERQDQLLAVTQKAGIMFANGHDLISKEDELLQALIEPARLTRAAICNCSSVSGRVVLDSCREMWLEHGNGSILMLSQQALLDRYPAFTCVLDSPDVLLRARLATWDSGEEYFLLLPVFEGEVACRFILLVSDSPWTAHNINALTLLAQGYGLTLHRNMMLHAISESESRMKSALENSNEGVWDWNIPTGSVYFSPVWLGMLGYHEGDLKPDVSTWEELLHPDDLSVVMEALNEHLLGRVAHYQTTHRLKHKDGSWRWILDRGKVVEWDEGGQPLRAIGTHLDVTETKLMEEKLARRSLELASANDEIDAVLMVSPVGFVGFGDDGCASFYTPCFARLMDVDDKIIGMTLAGLKEHMTEQHKVLDEIHTEGIDECIVENASRELVIKLRFMQEEYSTVGFRKLVSAIDITREYNLDKMKSYFMSVASHELRTPLSSICGFSELLLECPDSFTADEQKQMMLSIHSQSNVLASIVSQLLDVSRIESGEPMQSDMQVRKLDLAHFLEGVVSCLPSAEREAREINLDVIDSCAVLGDEGFLTRVFSNLLSNACKYSSIDSVVSVRVSSVRKGGRSMGLVEVIDQGIGMSPGEVAKAFEKFYRADASGKIKGMGLGLHIVKELVQAMGGSIEMSSQKHIGTTVRVYLPDGKGEL